MSTTNILDLNNRIDELEKNSGGGSADSAKRSDIATEFSTETSYTAGNFVYYEGKLYQFNADHSAGAWDPTDVAEANVTDQIFSNKSAIDGLSASDVSYDNTDSGLSATNSQGAIDELADKLADDYVSVTADGVKTVAQLLNDLYTALDLTKLNLDSKFIRITSTATVSYHIVEYTNSTAYFSYDVVTADHWQILTFILKNNDSAYRQVYDGSKLDKSSEVPANGTIFRIYY